MTQEEQSWRKQRTREHVIADLSLNHVERQAFRCGYTVRRITDDYGLDLAIVTYDRKGEPENGQFHVQLKATDHLRFAADGQTLPFRVQRRDLHHWLRETMPVILIVYDVQSDVAYWLYIQAYFARQPDFDLGKAGRRVTVHIPRANVVDEAAMRKFAEFRDRILAQVKGVVHHD